MGQNQGIHETKKFNQNFVYVRIVEFNIHFYLVWTVYTVLLTRRHEEYDRSLH